MTTKKKKKPSSTPALFDVPFVCADRFLQDHAGQIITEPRTAILELIANAYDAGATEILIDWPNEKGQVLQVNDNGIGMTQDEFQKRWGKLCYDRMVEQGSQVLLPPEVKGLKRQAFGRSGKGRHAPFCFADSYEVVSRKAGNEFTVAFGLASVGNLPFEVRLINQRKVSGHGTTIKLELQRHRIDVD